MPSVNCPSCKASLDPHERYGTESLVCTQCHAIVAVTGAKPRLLGNQTADSARLATSAPLRLGAKGTLRGKTVEVIGIIQRADGDYRWYECAIADEAGEVTWIWVDRGHFSLGVCEGKQCVTMDASREYRYQGRRLHLYNRGKASVVAAVGEFPYELDNSEHPQITDYIAPPFVASFESKVWWVFEYVPVAEIEAAFGIECEAPDGIGINQPAPTLHQRTAAGIITVLTLIALAVVHTLAGQHAIAAPLVTGQVDLQNAKSAPPQSFGPFRLDRRWNSLDVAVRSPVDNAWTDLTIALVDQDTGKSYWSSHGVEFYRGVDSDGPWSEGSPESSTIIRSIPAGNYMLMVGGDTGTWEAGKAPAAAEIRIFDRPAPTSNLLLAIGLALLVPGLYVALGYRFERQRWQDSDYSPYHRDDSNDE